VANAREDQASASEDGLEGVVEGVVQGGGLGLLRPEEQHRYLYGRNIL
jgi:hypothetical protein